MRKVFLIFVTFITACAVGPDYERPQVEIPSNWRFTPEESATLVNIKWWEEFNDPELNNLIQISLSENKDLKIATARVDEFLARYGVTRSRLFPSVDLDASYSRFRDSKSLDIPFSGDISNNYSGALTSSWEIDLWGRVRRLNESAYAQAMAQESFRRGVILKLVTSVAQSYVQLRQLDSQLSVANNTLKSRHDSMDLVNKRFNAGDASELDVRQAEAELAATQVEIPAIERNIAVTEDLLSVLLGRNPGFIKRGISISEFPTSKKIPAGLPSDLLEARPDVIQAEQELISANAEIGVAKAEFFPRFDLTGFFGFVSNDLSDWLRSPSRAWSFGPGANLPIFNAGRLSNQVEITKAIKEEALWNYQRVIQSALKDVEDALISYKKAGEQREARRYQVSVLRRYVELAVARYEAGASNYLDVLDAQRNLFNAELQFAEIQGFQVIALIQVYKSLGGGWVNEVSTQP